MFRPRCAFVVVAVPAVVALVAAPQVHAAWPTSPYANLAVSAALGPQDNIAGVSDGAGGAIFAWEDRRSSSNPDVYAQRVTAGGSALWTPDGVAVCVAANIQGGVDVVPDGSGGAFFTWHDGRAGSTNYDIYAQHVDAAGVPQWTANGVSVCSATGSQSGPRMTSDGAGGVIVTWSDFRAGSGDVYVQRLDAAGVPQWMANGVPLSTATGNQQLSVIVSDGSGGAFVAWEDARSGPSYDIYARRVDATGMALGTVDGTVVCNATGNQRAPVITTDGVGGALIAWGDERSGGISDVYAGRVNASGASVLINGVAICTATGVQDFVRIASDGLGGAYITWQDGRSSPTAIYAQRMAGDGARYWSTDGVALAVGAGSQFLPAIVGHGASGAVIAWNDLRSGVYDIYAQRVTPGGAVQWGAAGVALSIAVGDQKDAAIASDGNDGAIVAWEDQRSGVSTDVYAQLIERFGELGDPAPVITDVSDVPNDQGGKMLVEWTRSYLDVFPDFGVDAYTVWRRAPSQAAAAQAFAAETAAAAGGAPRARRVRASVESGQAVYWEYLASTPAHGFAGYSYVASTTSDSTGAANPLTAFQVVAERDGGIPYWASAPDSGYSVDDLAPATPTAFAGDYAAGVTAMQWNANLEPDLAGYRLYRGSDLAFVPGPGNLLAEPPSTTFEDAAGGSYVYKLTAVDVHGNESAPATLVPNGALDAAPSRAVAFALWPPAPNPVRGAAGAVVSFGMSAPGAARIHVHDVNGRRVRALAAGTFDAGAHSVRFDGRDDRGRALAPGVYLVRFEAAGMSAVRRMLVVP